MLGAHRQDCCELFCALGTIYLVGDDCQMVVSAEAHGVCLGKAQPKASGVAAWAFNRAA